MTQATPKVIRGEISGGIINNASGLRSNGIIVRGNPGFDPFVRQIAEPHGQDGEHLLRNAWRNTEVYMIVMVMATDLVESVTEVARRVIVGGAGLMAGAV
jgi:hypothetical protein